MGSGFSFDCPGCGYTRSILLGVGFRYASLEDVIDLVQASLRPKVLDILHNHAVTSTDYSHAMNHCPSCQDIAGRFFFKIEYDKGETFEPHFRCGKCQSQLELVTKSDFDFNTDISCPRCHKEMLSCLPYPPWD